VGRIASHGLLCPVSRVACSVPLPQN
jgi:hypothetical protein